MITLEHIEKNVCEYYRVNTEFLRMKTRIPKIVIVRQIAQYLSKELTTLSLQKIADYYGVKAHATIISNHKLVSDLIDVDKNIRDIVSRIKRGKKQRSYVKLRDFVDWIANNCIIKYNGVETKCFHYKGIALSYNELYLHYENRNLKI